MKCNEEIARSVIESVSKTPLELNRFIDFTKIYAIALKIAFRSDRQAAWELLGIYFRELEKIVIWKRKYNQEIDKVSERIKENSGFVPLNKRLKIILEEARKLKEDFGKDYRSTI
ncbi:MAG: hypothetical protein ACUVUQ_08090 [Thermodesulfovibrionales bacterium]